MISRVVSEDVIEFDVVDLVVSLSLESLKDDFVFLLCDLELHGVEDGSEPCVGYESTLALVLVLEKWFNQEPLVLDEPSESLKASIKNLFLFSV